MEHLSMVALFAISLVIIVFIASNLMRHHRSQPPRSTEKPEPFDDLTSLWVRELTSEALTKVHEMLMQSRPSHERTILYRWLARLSGLERSSEQLKRALDTRPWPERHPEATIWNAWFAYVQSGGDPAQAVDILLNAYREHGHTIGAPAIAILIHWLMESRRYPEVWDVVDTLPDSVIPRIQKRVSITDDVLRRILPHLLEKSQRERLRKVHAWLVHHDPDHPLTFWAHFQLERSRNPRKAVNILADGIRKCDHYWLYRTYETYHLEVGNPPAVQEFYVRRLHESGHDLRHRILLLLHHLRVEHLSRARELLDELAEPLGHWPPYWLWLGYVSTHQKDTRQALLAWSTYWTLIRQKAQSIHPFECEICGYGCPRWWDHCPSCRRLGTLDISLPASSGKAVRVSHLKTDLERVEQPFKSP